MQTLCLRLEYQLGSPFGLDTLLLPICRMLLSHLSAILAQVCRGSSSFTITRTVH